MIGTDAVSFFLSPLGVAIIYVWTFASLAAVQLTVRLILRFDVRETAAAAAWLTVVAVAVGVVYVQLTAAAVDPAVVARLQQQTPPRGPMPDAVQLYVVQQRLLWLPAAALPVALTSALVARRVLRMRPRGAVVCAFAMAILIAPWPALILV